MANATKLDMMRILKCAVSAFVFGVMSAGKIARALFRGPARSRCMVLYYHSIRPGERGRFAQQLDVILRHSQPVDVTGAIDFRPGVHYAGVTFDDAFENFIDQALPELRKRNVPSTM